MRSNEAVGGAVWPGATAAAGRGPIKAWASAGEL